MKGSFLPVVLNIVAWSLATFNLLFAIYIWQHTRS